MPSELMKKCRVPVRISNAILNDLSVRCPDEDGCWRGIDYPGVHWLTHQQCREILGDCEYQGNIGGDYIDPISPGVTRAYRALHAKINKALT